MITLAQALQAVIEKNALLQFGLRHQLFNLTQLSRFLLPQIQARGKKEASESAVLMALSRWHRNAPAQKAKPLPQEFFVDNIIITTNLCALSFPSLPEVTRALTRLYNQVHKKSGFITITHGIQEIRLIVARQDLNLAKQMVAEKPIMSYPHLASLGVTFKKNYLDSPGFYYSVFQALYFQNINVIEIASTANELIIYIHEDDVRLGFDTLYNRFLLSGRNG